MPTIFDLITGAFGDSHVSVQVTAQGGALTGTAGLIAGLIEHPPGDLGSLSGALQALPPPGLAISGPYGQPVTAPAGTVPAGLSSLTGGLTGGVGALGNQIGGLTAPLGEVLEVVKAVHAAAQADLLCTATPPPAAGGAGGGPPPAATTPKPVQQLNLLLDRFPQPFNVGSLIDWLYRLLKDLDLSGFHIVQVPILDDLRDPLVTLITWRNAMSTAELLGQLQGTLGLLETTVAASAGAVLAPIETALAAVSAQLPTAPLAQIADDLAVHLGTLRTAVVSGDLSTTAPAVTALNSRLDDYAAIRLNVQNSLAPHFATLADRLATLDLDLDDQMGRLVSLLQPESVLGFIPMPSESALALPGLEDLESWLKTLVDWLGDVTQHLDVAAIQGPLNTVAGTLQGAVDALDGAQVALTLQVQSLFGNVKQQLDLIDPAALLNEVKAAIAGFQTTLANQLQGLFAPVREAIGAVVTHIDNGLKPLKPADVVTALKDALDKLSAVLKNPDVLAAMNAIRDAIKGTADELGKISFAPLADQFIAEIDKLTKAFQALDTSQ